MSSTQPGSSKGDAKLHSGKQKHPVSVEVISQAEKNPQLGYSHFISLPLAIHPQLLKKVERFKESVLGEAASGQFDNADLGIDESIFIRPETLHLTVLMLKLWNEERVAAAAKVLQKISSEVLVALDNRPISLKFRGVMCMQDSPEKARVVYIPVDESSDDVKRLLRACQVIIDAFTKEGLVLDAQRPLKLHATVMNVSARKRDKWVKRFYSFDARHIIKVHGSDDWGKYRAHNIHLSQRFKFDEKGYYHCCASIPLP